MDDLIRKAHNRDAVNSIFSKMNKMEKYFLSGGEINPKEYVSEEEYGKYSTNIGSFIYSVDGVDAGFIDIWENNKGVGELAVGVAPEYRGRGIAKKLVECSINFAETETELIAFVCKIDTKNYKSIGLFESCGFKRVFEDKYSVTLLYVLN